jgi:hypothetical protein
MTMRKNRSEQIWITSLSGIEIARQLGTVTEGSISLFPASPYVGQVDNRGFRIAINRISDGLPFGPLIVGKHDLERGRISIIFLRRWWVKVGCIGWAVFGWLMGIYLTGKSIRAGDGAIESWNSGMPIYIMIGTCLTVSAYVVWIAAEHRFHEIGNRAVSHLQTLLDATEETPED